MNKVLLIVLLLTQLSFSQKDNWVKTEGKITDITLHGGKRLRSSAIIKFNLDNGKEQLGSAELFRIPFIGNMYEIGDEITIHYNSNNPVLLETVVGHMMSRYGMYLLIILGIVFSIKPYLKKKTGHNS